MKHPKDQPQMKWPNWASRGTLLGVALVLAFAKTAGAEPVKPTGLYSEAKLEASQEQTSRPQPVSNQASEPAEWVKQKWNTLKTLAGWGTGSDQTSAAKTASRSTSSPAVSNRKPAAEAEAASTDSAYDKSSPSASVEAQTDSASAGAKTSAQKTANSKMKKSVAGPGPADHASPNEMNPANLPDLPEHVTRTSTGIAVFDLKEAAPTDVIPRFDIDPEEKFTSARWALDETTQKTMNDKVVHELASPAMVLSKDLKNLTVLRSGMAAEKHQVADVVFSLKGKVARAEFDRIAIHLAPEAKIKLEKYTPLTEDESRFLSGLLLYESDKCAAAVGLFHELSKSKGYQNEGNYYLAMCSKKLGLQSDFVERARRIVDAQDLHYGPKILKEVGSEVPYEFTDSFGLALFKASSNAKFMAKVDETTKGNIAYLLTEFGASTERFKTALTWSQLVPKTHPKYLQARFLHALAEYQSGSKEEALKIQEELIAALDLDKTNQEFQALVSLNLARMYFQEKDFKNAHTSFLRVYKDHPMWLQSLTELGWAQLMSGDYEGAIGNMYSIQSPFFSGAYKPESYVIRTIGYLNICQYGDAYRTLSLLEHDYRPWLDRMESFAKKNSAVKNAYYDTVRDLLVSQKAAAGKKGDAGPKEVNGLPVQVVREMARHRDFTNLQKSFNRQLDEQTSYAHLEADVVHGLKHAQWLVNNSRKHADELRKNIASIKKNPILEKNRALWNADLVNELAKLNDYFFSVDLYNEAVAAWPDYKKDVIAGADMRVAGMRDHMEKILSNHLLQMKADLARDLDNNELLRYEVFAGSGENIRYQVAGGEQANRIPAAVLPKSKSLQWDFDGEYWEDEIGHYRSSLKNNCPASQRREQASSEGVSK